MFLGETGPAKGYMCGYVCVDAGVPHKLPLHGRPPVSKLMKDIGWMRIREEYDRLQPCTPKWKKRFAHEARELFGSDTAAGPVSAVGVYRDLGQLRGESFDVNEEIVQRSVAKILDAMLE